MERSHTTVKIGTNEHARTGHNVNWIIFGIGEVKYAIFMSDMGHKEGTPVEVDESHWLPVSAVYTVQHTSDGAGVFQSQAIRDPGQVQRIVHEGIQRERPLREFLLMVCEWIERGVL